jgi:hypothetical protein
VLQASVGDLAQLAEIRATVEDICNAFHVPNATNRKPAAD